jgi:exosome complex component RRP42
MEILDELTKDYVQDLLKKGKRGDGRAAEQYRNITIERNVLPFAEGSARVRLGNTQVLIGIKIGTGTPFADRPKEGILTVSAELLPLASPTFEPGPPNENSIELARVVDRGIRSSGCVDLESLFIKDGLVWAIYIDIYVLDADGNLIDASALAAMAALLNTRMPRYENDKVVREYAANLPVSQKVVSCTFAKIGSAIVLDPALDEEKAMGSRLTVSTVPGYVCAMQKGGAGAFTQQELLQCIDKALAKGEEIRKML